MGVIRVGQRLPDQKSNATTSSGFAWAAEKFITGWSERDELRRCMFVSESATRSDVWSERMSFR